MNNFKKSSYTIMLALTFFVASPFMIHKIWKNSADAKKAAQTPPPVSQSAAAPSASDATDSGSGEAEPASEGSTETEKTAQDTTSASAATEEAASTKFEYQTADFRYFDDALFIGDSRTVGLSEYGTLKNADYFCDIGLASSNIDKTTIDGKSFDDVIDAKQYGKVYLMLGINECGNDFESTMTSFRAIVEKLKVHQSDAIIYIMANLHVSSFAENGAVSNANIEYLNSRMSELADNKKVFFLDVNEIYTDEKGYLKSEYSNDGVHPYGQYYTLWCDFLCQHTVPTTDTEQPEDTETPPQLSTESTT